MVSAFACGAPGFPSRSAEERQPNRPGAHRLAALLAAAALSGCGRSPSHRAIEELSGRCGAQLGVTYAEAQAALSDATLMVEPACSATLLSMCEGPPPCGNDSCGDASAADELCQVLWYWLPGDPTACQGGYCVCELRLEETALDAEQGSAPICAARFLEGQPGP